MDKKEKTKLLKKFETLISSWLEFRQTGKDKNEENRLMLEMAKSWGVVSEILKSLEYKLEIEIEDRNRSRSIKPKVGDIFHDGIFSANYGTEIHSNIMKLHSYVLSALEKISVGIIIRENILPTLTVLLNVLNAFPDVVSRLKHRRSGKNPLDIKDEYDIQDIVYVMLKGIFPTLQYEDPTSKVGPNSSRADFTIQDLGIFIETKFISQKGKEKPIHDECLTDIQKYGKQDGCQKIIFFIYDPEKCIDNHYAFKSGIGSTHSSDGKEIEIITLIFN